MSKKNSSVILKNYFKSSGELSKIYENFKNKLDKQFNDAYLAALIAQKFQLKSNEKILESSSSHISDTTGL